MQHHWTLRCKCNLLQTANKAAEDDGRSENMNITKIDFNSDLGEGVGTNPEQSDTQMLDIVTSANIACAGHAGDVDIMLATLRNAERENVVVGAHPGYADKANFGRAHISMSLAEIERLISEQVGLLIGMAALAGTRVHYVKPHGALANLAAADHGVASAIVRAVRAISVDLAILAISGTVLEQAAEAQGAKVFSEIFADRAYLPNGQLVPRSHAAALIKDPKAAADRLISYLETGKLPTLDGPQIALRGHSICVHGDNAGAVKMAALIRASLVASGVAIAPFIERP